MLFRVDNKPTLVQIIVQRWTSAFFMQEVYLSLATPPISIVVTKLELTFLSKTGHRWRATTQTNDEPV